jgi:lactoylglutathione lyase
MKYLHTMLRVQNLEQSLDFFCRKLGLVETHRYDVKEGRFTLVFLSALDDLAEPTSGKGYLGECAPLIELTYNWDDETYDRGRNFGHIAFQTDNIYVKCQQLLDADVTLNRPPRDGKMAFIKSPDGVSIELLQKGEPLEVSEPWVSMKNVGTW